MTHMKKKLMRNSRNPQNSENTQYEKFLVENMWYLLKFILDI